MKGQKEEGLKIGEAVIGCWLKIEGRKMGYALVGDGVRLEKNGKRGWRMGRGLVDGEEGVEDGEGVEEWEKGWRMGRGLVDREEGVEDGEGVGG